jgi:hypothetical protein
MHTREDYRNGKCTHSEYYTEIALEAGLDLPAEMVKLVKESTCAHLNDVPLLKWDALAQYVSHKLGEAFRKRGDYPTLAGIVCAYKSLAIHLYRAELEA